MPTSEQQPNTSHLQSLESELSLTKAELAEFKKLPKEEQDRQKDEKLLELQRLNDKLDIAMQEAIKTGHLDEAIKLKEQLEREVNDLREKVEGTESPENILKIDRTADILKFAAWDEATIEDQDTDTRSTALTEIDLSKVKLDTSWLDGGFESSGEGRLEALKASGNIRLDAQILITLLNLPKEELNKKMEIIAGAEANKISIEDLKKREIYFDGTIIRIPGVGRLAFSLRWGGDGWVWNNSNLGNGWHAHLPSLVLAP